MNKNVIFDILEGLEKELLNEIRWIYKDTIHCKRNITQFEEDLREVVTDIFRLKRQKIMVIQQEKNEYGDHFMNNNNTVDVTMKQELPILPNKDLINHVTINNHENHKMKLKKIQWMKI